MRRSRSHYSHRSHYEIHGNEDINTCLKLFVIGFLVYNFIPFSLVFGFISGAIVPILVIMILIITNYQTAFKKIFSVGFDIISKNIKINDIMCGLTEVVCRKYGTKRDQSLPVQEVPKALKKAIAEAMIKNHQKDEDPYTGLTPEEKEKEEYIQRFKILKRQYKNLSIPEYNEHSYLQVMKKLYERLIREIHLDNKIKEAPKTEVNNSSKENPLDNEIKEVSKTEVKPSNTKIIEDEIKEVFNYIEKNETNKVFENKSKTTCKKEVSDPSPSSNSDILYFVDAIYKHNIDLKQHWIGYSSVLLVNQTDLRENGPWIKDYIHKSGLLVRPKFYKTHKILPRILKFISTDDKSETYIPLYFPVDLIIGLDGIQFLKVDSEIQKDTSATNSEFRVHKVYCVYNYNIDLGALNWPNSSTILLICQKDLRKNGPWMVKNNRIGWKRPDYYKDGNILKLMAFETCMMSTKERAIQNPEPVKYVPSIVQGTDYIIGKDPVNFRLVN